MSDDRARKPLPQINDVTRPFWDAAAQRRLSMPRCRQCDAFTFPPRPTCGECGGTELGWTELSGRGRVYSFTVIRQVVGGAAAKAFEPDIPYVVAWIDLAEGPRIMTNIVNVDPAVVYVGLPVEVYFERVSDHAALPFFTPVPE